MVSEETSSKINWVSTTLFCLFPTPKFWLSSEKFTPSFNEWFEGVNLFFEVQKFEWEGKDYAAKTTNAVKKKKSLFIYLLGRKGQNIYRILTVKNAKGETVENDDEKTIERVMEGFKDYCKPMKTLTIDRVEFIRKEKSKNQSFEDYLLNLKSSSKDCEWNNVTENNMIKL